MTSLRMDYWSASYATKAYLDTLELCGNQRRHYRNETWKTQEPGSNEFVSALAAGMKAKLIVEVTTSASPSTIALAAAARQTGGRLVCILPEPVLDESKRVIKDAGLKDLVEFKTGEPSELLSDYENIDFSLVDCKNDDYTRLLNMLDVNPRRSVVVANNLVGERKGWEGNVRRKNNKEKVAVRSLKNPIGKGMEVTVIGRKRNENEKRDWGGGGGGISTSFPPSRSVKKTKSKWLVKVDKESGEEHFFRVPK
ncbi:hypothetical protein FEM48_Zijuj08G0041000 [Ziziphus jujuba var. spinosa]|uniref:S-adenosyl-L-methionine-dependent methyltransferase n=1 Tax=Ziziphus jujuba var. spinosa TaxID=714518 RepID=A0A978UWW6_ZIZJJ|nr:hypothetical protein FEM48_Zijuj08G0041000 [Ziziphus jujuba var. spinosa]